MDISTAINLPNRSIKYHHLAVDKGMSQYGELLAAFVLVLQEMGVSKEDMKKIFHDNAKTFYRIECCA